MGGGSGQRAMMRRMIKRSLGKNRLVSVLMAALLALSSGLLVAAVILAFGVAGAVEGFMESARTPHFMQMHQGSLDEERLMRWAGAREDVVATEVIEYLNVENSQLRFAGRSLDAEIQQNGFVTQPQRLDFLLSPTGERLEPRPGEVYVPYFYERKYGLGRGDTVAVATEGGVTRLTVAGAFRDSQMNSTLASSKRLLVSHADFAALAARSPTEPERLISFRLESPAAAAEFEAAYLDAGLENDGPALTWAMFRLINSMNDGLTALLFLLMSGVVLLVTLLCVRFTLHTTLEEDLNEIGVMKALGVSTARVGGIYLGKYGLLLGAGAATGLLAALLLRGAILANVRRNLGHAGDGLLGVALGAACAALLLALVMLFVRRVLRRLGRLTPVETLGGVAAGVSARPRPRSSLAPSTGAAVNAKLAWANVRHAPTAHLTLLAVALLTTLALLVPFRFGATARSAEFVTYMGIGQYDLRVDLLGHEDAAGAAAAIGSALAGDERVERVEVYLQEVETARAGSGESGPLRVDYGDHAAFPVRYSAGRAPEAADELALSELNAERFGAEPGSALFIDGPNGATGFRVSGVYQDVTNGGKTAKALPGPTTDAERPGAMLAVSLTDPAQAPALSAAILGAAAGAQVIDTGTYVQQMLGDLIRVMDGVALVFAVVAVLLTALMAALGVRLMLVRERRANAVMNALGFTAADLRWQYLIRTLLPVGAGALLGLALASPAGNLVGNLVFGSVGISGLSLTFAPLSSLLGAALVLASAWLTTLVAANGRSGRGLAARLRA